MIQLASFGSIRRVGTFAAVLGLLCAGCAGAGPYGYARTYVPLDGERDLWRTADGGASWEDVRRAPQDFEGRVIAWFGVVQSVTPEPDGFSRVRLEYRRHEERHLCQEETENTCRVTISERDGGSFTIHVHLRPEDTRGENRVAFGSMLLVYGAVARDQYDERGGPVLFPRHYRHWPRGQYVTTAARGSWLR